MTKSRFNLRKVVAITICLAGFFSANNVLAQDFQDTDAIGNSALTQEKDTSFVLKKNSKIMVETKGLIPMNNKVRDILIQKLKVLGFCCVYGKNDKNASTASIIIVVHPNDPFMWAFRIRDIALDKEVYYDRAAHNTTINDTLDKFIKTLMPFIAE